MQSKLRFLPAIVWFFGILFLLCLPGSTIPKYPWLALIHADKLLHITLFFLLCFLFTSPFKNQGLSKRSMRLILSLITVLGVLYGVILEFVQERWILNRSFEVNDILADASGCLLSFIYWIRWIRLQNPERPNKNTEGL